MPTVVLTCHRNIASTPNKKAAINCVGIGADNNQGVFCDRGTLGTDGALIALGEAIGTGTWILVWYVGFAEVVTGVGGGAVAFGSGVGGRVEFGGPIVVAGGLVGVVGVAGVDRIGVHHRVFGGVFAHTRGFHTCGVGGHR